MALKGEFTTTDEAPEFLREHLREVEGRYVVDIEGYVPKKTLDEFRSNNRALKKQTDDLAAKLADYDTRFKDVDPEEYRTLKTSQPDTQKQIADIEARLQKKYDTQFEQERQARKAAEDRFHQELIGNEVSLALPKIGAYDTAYEELKTRATRVCKIVDGKPVPHRGEEPLYSEKEPTKYMPMAELLASFRPDIPHCFKTSNGAGTPGGLSQGSGNSRIIAAGDAKGFLDNVEAIAKGKMDVEVLA